MEIQGNTGPEFPPPTVTIPIGTPLREVEKLVIAATLRHNDGNISRSARMLGIDRSTLHKKIKEYQLRDRVP